jgi:hypothetical protein
MPLELSESQRKFLRAAASASWFNESFEYRTVSQWCGLTESEGKNTLDVLIIAGLIQQNSLGGAALTAVGKSTARNAS